MHCPEPLHFLTLLIMSITFILSATQMLVRLFDFGLCCRKFVLCLFGECPRLCTIEYFTGTCAVVAGFAERCLFLREVKILTIFWNMFGSSRSGAKVVFL